MFATRPVVLIGGVLFAFVQGCSAPFATAEFADASGRAQVYRNGEFTEASQKHDLEAGDTVIAGATAVRICRGATKIFLEPGARARVEADHTGVESGVVWIASPDRERVETAVSNLAGATLHVLVGDTDGDTRSVATLLSGNGSLTGKDGSESVSLTPGQRVVATRGRLAPAGRVESSALAGLIARYNELERSFPSGASVLCPDVRRMSAADAGAAIARAGLATKERRTVDAGDIAIGQIARQSPDPTTRLEPGDTVTVFRVAAATVVPDVVGRDRQAALRGLATAKLEAQFGNPVMTGKHEVGTVVEQSPQAGTRVPEGDGVELVLEAASVVVPNLDGLTLAQAQAELAAAKLTLRIGTREPKAGVSQTVVAGQEVAAGERIAEGGSLSVDLSDPGVSVPSVVGRSLEQARAQLARVGLRLEQGGSRADPRRPGRILEQVPPFAEVVSPGSAVRVIVAR